MRLVIGAVALVLALGCGEESDSGEEEVIEAVEPEEAVVPGSDSEGNSEDTETAPAAETLSYAMHEWGLIDFDLGDSRVEYAAGPGSAEAAPVANGNGGSAQAAGTPANDTRPNVVNGAVNTANDVLDILTGRPQRPSRPQRRKPVLYFHLSGPGDALTFDLTVDLGETARMLEHYPPGTLEGHSVAWSGVSLARESCTGGPYPTAESDACQNVADDYCEGAELGGYEANDAGCLTVGGAQQNFLFYRGDGPSPDLPLAIARNADGSITLTNNSLGEPVGELLRFRRTGDIIQVAQVAVPDVGESISIGLPALAATDAHREVVRTQLREIGLTDGEAGAFERAWFAELFDGAANTPHAFPDAVFFFLPQSQVDDYAHIEASPPPAETVRAMAIRAGWTSL